MFIFDETKFNLVCRACLWRLQTLKRMGWPVLYASLEALKGGPLIFRWRHAMGFAEAVDGGYGVGGGKCMLGLCAFSSHKRATSEREKHEGQPNPIEFGGDHFPSSGAHKKCFQAQGRNFDGSPREEVACVGKWPENCHAQSAVGQSIQKNMA